MLPQRGELFWEHYEVEEKMNDITKYKNVSLKHADYHMIDKIRKVLVPNTILSRSQTISILVNEKVKSLNGKLKK